MVALRKQESRRLSDYSEAVNDERMGGNAHYLKVVHFDNIDHCEATAITLDSTESLKRGGGAIRTNTEKKDMSPVSLKKSQQRARKNLRHKCLSIKAETMITCTFKELVTDLDSAWPVFKYFIKLMNKFNVNRFTKGFHYVVVPEFQKRGAVHFHLATTGRFEYNFVRKLWRRAAGKFGGNIDVSNPKKGGVKRWSPISIAKYLAKYISKNDSVQFNKKRYSASRGIVLPEPMRGWLPLCGGAEVYFMCQLVENLCHNPVQDIFQSDSGRYPFSFVST
jgi:azurin